jgi:hypothetical protein
LVSKGADRAVIAIMIGRECEHRHRLSLRNAAI